METIKLNFDANILGSERSLNIELPYSNGIVATSKFCPAQLLSGDVDLLAALNGEPLEDFVADCRLQLRFAEEEAKASSIHEAFIAGLVASVVEHTSRAGKLTLKDYLLHMDVFSHLIFSAGIPESQVSNIYSKILDSVMTSNDNCNKPINNLNNTLK